MHWQIAVILTLVALAGCADETGPEPEPDVFEGKGPALQATEDTGILRGVVVDETVTPIEGVTITVLDQELSAQSDADGLFGFDGLEPGTYFLIASRPGFLEVQSSAEVVAGEDQPPIVRIQLERDATFNPYSTTIPHQGYYQCGLAFVVVCGAPNILLGDGTAPDSSTWTFYFDGQPDFVQTEMVWETTQTVSPDLRLEVEALDAGCTGGTLIGNTLGPSPLRMTANATQLSSRGVGGEECGLYHSVFAGDVLNQAHCDYWDPVPLVKCGVGFSVEQNFEWFVTAFYGYAPSEDWWYIEDGPLPAPS